jgi:F-type H+-transporting ATPase subunit a
MSSVSSDLSGTSGPAETPVSSAPADLSARLRKLLPFFIVLIVVLDAIAFIGVPPYPKDEPGQSISGISDLIGANLELPAPHVVADLAPNDPVADGAIVFFHPSISAPILTTWILMAIVLVLLLFVGRMRSDVPRGLQNFAEWTWESLESWAVSLGGAPARPHVPLFIGFFLFILLSNWSGLIPIFGKIEALRAPTSDVNVTVGLALVAFVYFQGQGFRTLGIRGYLGKFFVFNAGPMGLFVGLIEFMLEFIKPVTLAMRLFGNIFGGEVALGVITALSIAAAPAIMLLLEGVLNFVQALIFSTLMLMYTVLAVESHGGDHEAAPEPAHADVPVTVAVQPAH